MKTAIEVVFENLAKSKKLPIIFTGSGFSKRYTSNKYSWPELLKHCINFYSPRPENQYKIYEEDCKMQFGGERDWFRMNERIGSFVTRDFNQYFYSKEQPPFEVQVNESPIKVFIARELEKYELDELMMEEISVLKTLGSKMLTVVTTNYDTFIEDNIFPEHDKVIGQKIFEVSELGTLFKIHGCVSEPNSIIFNENDYERFNKKRKILSSKLINLFSDNPVIFMGYSISDKNIRNILYDIFSCIDDKKEVELLEKRFVYIDYDKDVDEMEIKKYTIEYNGTPIRMTQIVTNTYMPVLEGLQKLERKTSFKEIKIFKDLIYNVVEDQHATEAKVMNLLTSENSDSDKIVVAITTLDQVSKLMKELPTINDLLRDIVFDDLEGYDSEWLLKHLFPLLRKSNSSLPVHKYLSKANISNEELLPAFQTIVEKEPKDYLNRSIRNKEYLYKQYKTSTLEEVYLSENGINAKIMTLVLKAVYERNAVDLENFLKKYYDELNGLKNQHSLLKKLVFILDIIKHKVTKQNPQLIS